MESNRDYSCENAATGMIPAAQVAQMASPVNGDAAQIMSQSRMTGKITLSHLLTISNH